MDALLAGFRTTTKILNLALAGLPDEVARIRSRGESGPSIGWTVGHLLESRIKALVLLGDARPNPYTAQFGHAPATDGSDYAPLSEMLTEWQSLDAALEAAIVSTRDADRPLARSGVHGESTVRDQLAFLAWHEAYHTGVVGAMRKSAGLPGPAELVMAARKAS
jgi:uncharacterized damage-inducible protein DinB